MSNKKPMTREEYDAQFESKLSIKHVNNLCGSEDPGWICICRPYMYTANTLTELVQIMSEGWEHDKYLVG